MYKCFLLVSSLLYFTSAYAQNDTIPVTGASIFEKITKGLESYKIDTSAPPDDKLSRMIFTLRNLKGGFNINEAIDFKIEEDRKKGEMPVSEINALADYFKTGQGKILLDNAVTWIYRHHFSYKEVKALVKFYRSSAGQKLATEFPIIMLKSLAAGEIIKGNFKTP